MSRLACLATVLLGLFVVPVVARAAEEPSSSQLPTEQTAEVIDSVFSQPDAELEVLPKARIVPWMTIIRAQNAQAPYDENPSANSTLTQPPVMMMPPTTDGIPQANGGMWPGSPILAPNGMPGGSAPNATLYGTTGPQPYRFGWSSKWDAGILPKEGTDGVGGDLGDFGIVELNGELRHTVPLPNQWIWSIAPQASARFWEGPVAVDLPGDVYRFGLDFALTTPAVGPYTIELGFTPSVGTDFETSLGSEAWMWDGRGALFIRTAPQWMWVLGAMFWDRVDDQILPYAGIVFTPNDRWEIRAVFPNPQISLFLGCPCGVPYWLYVAGEYHIEAYQIAAAVPGGREQIEIEDWRLVLGLRSEANGVSSFLEAGWVFSRDVEFTNGTAGFDIDDGFIARAGLKF